MDNINSEAMEKLLNFINDKIVLVVGEDSKKELAEALSKSVQESNLSYYYDMLVDEINKEDIMSKLDSIPNLYSDLKELSEDYKTINRVSSGKIPVLTSEIGNDIYNILSSIEGFFDFSTGVGIYLKVVFKVGSLALEKGLELINSHKQQLNYALELLEQIQGKPNSDDLDSSLSELDSISSSLKDCKNNLMTIKKCFSEEIANNLSSDTELYSLYSELSQNLTNYESTLNSTFDEAKRNLQNILDSYNFGTSYDQDTIDTINSICSNLGLKSDSSSSGWGSGSSHWYKN